MANYLSGAHFNKRMYDIMANKIAALTALNKELSEENSSLKNKIAEYGACSCVRSSFPGGFRHRLFTPFARTGPQTGQTQSFSEDGVGSFPTI